MSKNNIHCIVINAANEALFPPLSLTRALNHFDENVFVETISGYKNNVSSLIKKLTKGNISLLFITRGETEDKTIQHYENLLRRYSIDTILVTLSTTSSPLMRDLSGIENCGISLEDTLNSPIFIKNLIRYAKLKKDFRLSKRLLSITDKRNRWLVNITQEPIAYIYKGTHIHANASYLSLFDFQSAAELKSSTIWELIPKKNHNMFKKFIKKQHQNIDMQQTLLMNMQTINQRKVRAGIRIASAVINKTQCLQVWIHKIEENLTLKIATPKDTTADSPWKNLPEKKIVNHINRNSLQSSAPITKVAPNKTIATPQRQPVAQTDMARKFNQLRKSLKTIKLNLQPLTDTNPSEISHYFAKLQFDTLEQTNVAKHLAQSNLMLPAIFWDHVLLIELSKKLHNNKKKDHQYLLSLSESSINNNFFIHSLIHALKKLPKNHPHIVLLLPQRFFLEQNTRMRKLKILLREMNSSVGIYHFIPNKHSLEKVLKDKPSYISFSSKWTSSIERDEEQLENLSRLTLQLEKANIQVILS